MGSIPQVQLPESPLNQYGNIMKLKAMMQGQQLEQLQIKGEELQNEAKQHALNDQQAQTAAMREWDGKDWNAYPGLIIKHGGSAQAVLQAKQGIIAYQAEVAKMKKAQLEVEDINGDHIAQAIDNVKNMPLEQQPAGFEAAKAKLIDDGHLDPQHAQGLQYQGPQQLDALEKLYIGHTNVVKQQLEGQQQAESAAKQANEEAQLPGTKAKSAMEQLQLKAAQSGGAVPGVPLENQEANAWLKANPGKDLKDFLVWKAQHSPSVIVQGGASGAAADPMVDAVGQGRVDLATILQRMAPAAKSAFMAQLSQKYPNYSQATYGVEKKVEEKYTSGNVSDQLMAINTAREHMKTFRQVADALDNGNVQALNKLGNALGVQFGSDKKSNFQIAAQAFGGEVGRAFDGAGVVAGERKEAQDNFNAAMSKGQFKGAIEIVDKLLAGKQKSAQDTYNTARKGKPNFGEEKPGAGKEIHYKIVNGQLVAQ